MDLYNHKHFLKDELNASSREEVFYAFKTGVKEGLGLELSFESLIVLLAHSALETGHWKRGLHNWNFGNVKAYPNRLKEGEYFTMFRCSEILNGKEIFFDPPHLQTHFRAFTSKEEGVKHHLSFLLKKYTKAWEKALVGDPAGYSHELKKGGYYTANEASYTNTLVSVFNTFKRDRVNLESYKPVEKPEPIEEEDIPDTDPSPPPSIPELPKPDTIPTVPVGPMIPPAPKVPKDMVPKSNPSSILFLVFFAGILGYAISFIKDCF